MSEVPHTPEWQTRVIEERAALNAKIVALTDFVFRSDPAFEVLADQDKALLRAQRSTMLDYSAILDQRIARFDA